MIKHNEYLHSHCLSTSFQPLILFISTFYSLHHQDLANSNPQTMRLIYYFLQLASTSISQAGADDIESANARPTDYHQSLSVGRIFCTTEHQASFTPRLSQFYHLLEVAKVAAANLYVFELLEYYYLRMMMFLHQIRGELRASYGRCHFHSQLLLEPQDQGIVMIFLTIGMQDLALRINQKGILQFSYEQFKLQREQYPQLFMTFY